VRFERRSSHSSVSSSPAVCQPGSFKGTLTGLRARHYFDERACCGHSIGGCLPGVFRVSIAVAGGIADHER
jgi:hypothetical protein